MVHQVRLENGEIHEFPDDITLEEMNSILNNKSNQTIKGFLPQNRLPLGMSVAGGAISSFLPKEQKSIARALPQVAFGQQPGISEKLATGFGEYLPYMSAGLPAGFLKSLGALGGIGALSGQQQHEQPVEGAIGGVAGGLLGGAIGQGLNFLKGKVPSGIQNYILNYLQKQSQKGAAATPEEVRELVKQKYVTPEGKMMKVDIGSLTGEPTTSGLYSGLQYLPFSKVAEQKNILNKQLLDRQIHDSQNVVNLEKQKLNEIIKNFNVEKDKILATREPNVALQQQLNSQIVDKQKAYDFLKERQMQLENQKDLIDHSIDESSNLVNQLPKELIKRGKGEISASELSKANANEVKEAFKRQMEKSNANYKPLNESKVRIDTLPNRDFKKYNSAANDIEVNEENFKNLFGPSSSEFKTIEKELNLAKEFKEKGQEYAIQVPDVIRRIQNLGDAYARAKSLGKNNESRLLLKLYNGLKEDFSSILENNGHNDLAEQFEKANTFHKENIIPYYLNPTIRNVIKNNKIPITDALALAFHHPENIKLLSHLPRETQMSMLADLISKGKGTAEGSINLSPEQISKNFQGINRNIKKAIKQYAPNEYDYLEKLPEFMRDQKLISQNLDRLGKQEKEILRQMGSINKHQTKLEKANEKAESKAENLKEPSETELEKAIKNFEESKRKRLEYKAEPSARSKALKGLGATAGLGIGAGLMGHIGSFLPLAGAGILGGRALSKALTDPALINAYMRGGQIPVNQDVLAQILMRMLPGLTVPTGEKR